MPAALAAYQISGKQEKDIHGITPRELFNLDLLHQEPATSMEYGDNKVTD